MQVFFVAQYSLIHQDAHFQPSNNLVTEENNTVAAISVAVAGNPNTGKSSLFNRLTGLRQHVGNYPGVTVEKKTGFAEICGVAMNFLDLPGTYSLTASSPDEAVVCDVLFGKNDEKPDIVLCVVDSTSLGNSLFMAFQIADLGIPMVIAMNMTDEAGERGIEIDDKMLSVRLGVPCVPVSAKTGEGLDALRKALADVSVKKQPMKKVVWPESVLRAIEILRTRAGFEKFPDAQLRRLIFDNSGYLGSILGLDEKERREGVKAARSVLFSHGMNPMTCEAVVIHHEMHHALHGATNERRGYHGYGFMRMSHFRRWFWKRNNEECFCGHVQGHGHRHEGRKHVYRHGFERMHAHSAFLDRLFLHRFWGLLIFVGVMYLMFQAVYSWSAPFMTWIDLFIEKLHDFAGGLLFGHPLAQSLVADGIIGGVGACLTFLPQILILFMFIAVLEDSGYLPRAAFLMDKMFSWSGLSGRSFVPLLSCYACAVPGIMATRTIRDSKARLATILIAPMMSCSARLPVYVLFIGLFVEPAYGPYVAALTLFGMHLVGLVLAGPAALIYTKFVLKSKPQPFLLELPPYRLPRVGDVILRMYERGKVFLFKAGTVIFIMTVFVWALVSFPREESVRITAEKSFVASYSEAHAITSDEVENKLTTGDEAILRARDNAIDAAYMEHSYLGRFGKFVQPVFDPLGFDWKLTVAVLSSLPAREVVVSTIGVVYSVGSDVEDSVETLRGKMADEKWTEGGRAGEPVYTLPMAFAFLIFFALCLQCAATLSVIGREAGWRWAAFDFTVMTALAWVAGALTYQIGNMI
jgi:ferrous iron transport protein B